MVIIDSEQFSNHLKGEMGNYMSQSLVVGGKDYNYIENPKIKAGGETPIN